MKKLFLVRHAAYIHGGSDPVISRQGERQALLLALKIKGHLEEGSVTIWSSSAKRAEGTAQIIKQQMQLGMQLTEMMIEEKLWSDNSHKHDFDWLEEKIKNFKGDNLIIVSHLEYVQDFPGHLGFRYNHAGYAQGVVITGNECTDFNY